MKKVTLLFVIGISFVILPSVASANILNDFVNWLVPSQLKPLPVTERQVTGGIDIVPIPAVQSGDTSQVYYLPALGSRSFKIINRGAVDLFLNKTGQLSYSATPATAPGDVPGSFALNVGVEREISIYNPATSTPVFLSKTDLGIVADAPASTPRQASVFISDVRATAAPASGDADPLLASFTFSFTFNNPTVEDVYVSRLINPLSFVNLSSIAGATTTVKFITSRLPAPAGDSLSVFVIPAGTNRPFEITGIIDNSKGAPGPKTLSLTEIFYSNSASSSSRQSLPVKDFTTSPLALGVGTIKWPVEIRPVATAAPAFTSVPTPTALAISPSPLPSISVSASLTPSVSPTPLVSPVYPPASFVGTTTVSNFIVTAGSTRIDSPIVEGGEIVGFPVTFTFTVEASGRAVYLSRNPAVAFATQNSGFGSILPRITTITATTLPPKEGDTGSYYKIMPSTARSFSAFAVLRNDGITAAGSKILQIVKINFGVQPTALAELSTTQNTANLKAIVKLAPKGYVDPSPTPTPTVYVTPAAFVPSPTPSATPTPSFIALCYPTPSNPVVGDTVYWQVVQSGGEPPFTYNWTGTDSLKGGAVVAPHTYTSSGRKDVLVSVTSKNRTVTASCHAMIDSAPSPSASPAPTNSPSQTPSPSAEASPDESPSSSPSPSEVSQRGDLMSRGMVAAAFYSLGEFLDSLF